MKIFILSLALGAFVTAAPCAWSDPGQRMAAGTVITVSGKVTLYSTNNSEGALSLGQPVFAGDEIKTGPNGRAQLILADGTQLKLNYSTDITLRDKDINGKASPRGIALVKIALGDLWAKVTKKGSKLEFEMPSAVAAVKGTNPAFSVSKDGTTCISLFEGKMDMSSGGCSQMLTKMHGMCIQPGQKACEAKTYQLTSTASFADEISGPTSANVTLNVKDANGQTQQVKLLYSK